MGPSLSTIIVNWNVKEHLRRCLASLHGEGRCHAEAEVIVIDNASHDGSAEMVANDYPQVRLIVNEDNRGFAAACNQGLALSRGRYLLFLNPDTEVRPHALDSMLSYLEANPEVGIVGPQLLNSDGSVQSSRRRFPSLATAFIESTILQRYLPHSPLLRHYYCLDKPDDEEQEVDWVVGACFLVRRSVIDDIGALDERFFMYSEEMDFCYRAKQAGWRVAYLPQAQVVHHYGRSSEQDLSHRHVYFQDSKCKFFSKHHGALAGMALRGFILATYLFQLGEEGLKLLLGHKRRLRRERIGIILQVVRSGLRT